MEQDEGTARTKISRELTHGAALHRGLSAMKNLEVTGPGDPRLFDMQVEFAWSVRHVMAFKVETMADSEHMFSVIDFVLKLVGSVAMEAALNGAMDEEAANQIGVDFHDIIARAIMIGTMDCTFRSLEQRDYDPEVIDTLKRDMFPGWVLEGEKFEIFDAGRVRAEKAERRFKRDQNAPTTSRRQ